MEGVAFGMAPCTTTESRPDRTGVIQQDRTGGGDRGRGLPELTMPAYVHPLRTFGDLAAFDLEAAVNCRCGRRGTIDTALAFFRDRPISGKLR